jgi:CheY-like chemotaxis protein
MPPAGTLTSASLETAVPDGSIAADGAVIRAGRYALLVVRDDGVGMDTATQARIFEPFFTTKPTGEGTGLGLAAAYGIMSQNGGYIAVSSAPGRGAAFTLYLPAFTEPTPADHGKGASAPGRQAIPSGSTVLVVDDEPQVLAVVARSLAGGGFRVLQASDGASALEVVARHGRPDLVLTDLMMPGISGVELARRLKDSWPELPILFMSGYSVDDLRREGVTGIEDDLLQKPFTPDRLVTGVVARLSRASEAEPAI